MSRSHRRRSITAITTSKSEKRDKRHYNRAYRRAARQAVQRDSSADTLPHLKEHSDPWGMDKDGKRYFDASRFPEMMRK